MKKIFILFFILLSVSCYSQHPLQRVLKTYFRTHPFEIKFSSFIASLQKDPWLTIDEFYRRTDSNFFFLSGTYQNFNPFRFAPKEVRLVLAEEEIIHSDSLKTHDTIMNLQLMCVTDTGIINSKGAQEEFDRFDSKHANQFYSKTHNVQNDKGSNLITEVYNYFIFPLSIAPITIAWGKLPDNKYAFTITLRFKVRENAADYILTPGEHL